MNTILFKYIAKKFVVTFLFTLGLFILIAVIFDISEKIDDFIEGAAPFEAIVFDYYLNFIPYFMNLFSPLFIFISAVYFTSRMAYNTEIVAILSTGTNFYKILTPYLFVGFLMACASFYLNGWVIPKGNIDRVAFENRYLKNPIFNKNFDVHRQTQPGEFIYMNSYNYADTVGFDFSLERFDDQELTFKLRSETVRWNEKDSNWLALNYKVRLFNNESEEFRTGDTLPLKFPLKPEDFGRKTMSIQTMTTPQLTDFIEKERMRGEEMVTVYELEKYKRTSMPAATLVLVVIAMAISSRKVRGGMGMHLGLGLIIAFSYILLMQFSTTFAINANLHPNLAVWIPNFLYGILAIFLVRSAPK